MNKTKLIAEGRALVRRVWPSIPDEVSCLYYAVGLQVVLGNAGLRTMLQAGTAQWPMIRPEDDDGVIPNCFAYEWQGLDDPFTRSRIEAGMLPEVHCWLAHRDPDTIIDTTTRSLVARAALAKLTWTAAPPPDFVWSSAHDMDRKAPGARYMPVLEACEVANRFAREGVYPRLMKVLRRSR